MPFFARKDRRKNGEPRKRTVPVAVLSAVEQLETRVLLAGTLAATKAQVTVTEGTTATNTGTVSEPHAALSASFGTVVNLGDGNWSWSASQLDGPDDSQTVTITATWADATQSSVQFALTVNNAWPQPVAGSTPEFQINLPDAGRQRVEVRSTEYDRLGNFFVTWWNTQSTGNPGVFVRKFNAMGQPLSDAMPVNQFVGGSASGSSIAVRQDGSFVVAWRSSGQDGDAGGIYGRVFDAECNALTDEFLVNQVTEGNQGSAWIDADEAGNFVVVWRSEAGDVNNLIARRFDAQGQALGDEFQLNDTGSTGQVSSFAMDAFGNFVAVWNNGSNDNAVVYARQFNAFDQALSGSFVVGSYTGNGEEELFEEPNATVAMSRDGRFAIAWNSWQSATDGYDIFARLYDAAGNPADQAFKVNQLLLDHQILPAVAMGDRGDFVVSWTISEGSVVRARRYDSAGQAVGGEFLVSEIAGKHSFASSAISSRGDLLFVWQNELDGTNSEIRGRTFSALTPDSIPTVVYRGQVASKLGRNFDPGDDTIVEMWASVGQVEFDGETGAWRWSMQTTAQTPDHVQVTVFARDSDGDSRWTIFNVRVRTHRPYYVAEAPAVPLVEDFGLIDPLPDLNGRLLIVRSTSGGEAADRLAIATQGSGPGQISRSGSQILYGGQVIGTYNGGAGLTPLVITLNENATPHALLALLKSITYRSASGEPGTSPRLFDFTLRDAAGNESFVTRSIVDVYPTRGSDFRVNAETYNDQQAVATRGIAYDAHGNFVVTWTSEQDSGSLNFRTDVYMRRFNSHGAPLTGDILVRERAGGADVAMAPDGSFVIVYIEGRSHYAQRFDALGTRLGEAILIDRGPAEDEATTRPKITMDDAGSFVVAWSIGRREFTYEDYEYDVYARMFDAHGAARGLAFRVNLTRNADAAFDIASDAAGNFVVVWNDVRSTSWPSSVRARRYDANGQALTNDVSVWTYPVIWRDTNYPVPSVDMARDGRFVVAWLAKNPDNGRPEIHAQLYDASGVRQGSWVTVTGDLGVSEVYPDVAIDETGKFIVAWVRRGNDSAFLGQWFDAAARPVGTAFRLNGTADGGQNFHEGASVALNDYGDVAAVWNNRHRDGHEFGVYARLLRNDPAGNQAPIVTNHFPPMSMYTENDPPVIISPTVTVHDNDSANFAGGSFSASVVKWNGPTDRLTILHQGTGVGQIGIQGNEVTFGGVVIGTFSGGVGNTLQVALNANATAGAVQALARRIAYSNTGDSFTNGTVFYPEIQFVVTDGDGGSSVPTKFQVQFTAVNDAPTVTSPETPIVYTENAPPILLNPTGTVHDPDSSYDGATLVVRFASDTEGADRLTVVREGNGPGQISVYENTVRFGGTVIGTFSGGLQGAPLEFVFNSAASTAAVQALLRRLAYYSASDNPAAHDRVVEFVVTDSEGVPSEPAQRTVEIRAVNDPPRILGLGGPVSYGENAAPRILAGGALLDDPDSADFEGGLLGVRILSGAHRADRLTLLHQGTGAGQIGVEDGLEGKQVLFGGVVIGTFREGVATVPLLVTLNANASRLAVQALMRRIAFSNESDDPGSQPREIQFLVTDGDRGTSEPTFKTVNVTPANDRPEIQRFGEAPVTYRENAEPRVIAGGALVVDPDSRNFAGGVLTVNFFAGAENDDRLSIAHLGTGPGQVGVSGNEVTFGGVLVGTFIGGTRTEPLRVTFNEAATREAVQAVVRRVAYHTLSENPGTQDRTVRLTVSDGDGGTSLVVSKIVRAQPVNDAPTLGGIPESASGAGSTTPVIVAPAAAASDVDSSNLGGGVLDVRITSGAESSDRLSILHQGTGAGKIGVAGDKITFGGVEIGTFVARVQLRVTLNANATPAAVQALLRRIAYNSVAANPGTQDRAVQFTLTDGDGGTSSPATVTLTSAQAARGVDALFAAYDSELAGVP